MTFKKKSPVIVESSAQGRCEALPSAAPASADASKVHHTSTSEGPALTNFSCTIDEQSLAILSDLQKADKSLTNEKLVKQAINVALFEIGLQRKK